jgi:cellobiose phosphorylase
VFLRASDFKLTRKFREGTYHITVKNPSNVQKGVKSMIVDGRAVDGCVIPYVKGQTEYNVEVVMG